MELKRLLAKAVSLMGYSELRPKQEEVIMDFLCGSDVFISLLTGSSKFLCYSLQPAVFNEVRCLPSSSIIFVVSCVQNVS